MKKALKEKELLKIEEEAMYNALKKFHKELTEQAGENEESQTVITKDIKQIENNKLYNLIYYLEFFFCPWLVYKNLKKNNRLYEDVIILFVSVVLELIGVIGWIASIFGIIISIKLHLYNNDSRGMVLLGISIFILLLSNLLTILGIKFSGERDAEKIYSFSATIMAILSFVVAAITLCVTVLCTSK